MVTVNTQSGHWQYQLWSRLELEIVTYNAQMVPYFDVFPLGKPKCIVLYSSLLFYIVLNADGKNYWSIHKSKIDRKRITAIFHNIYEGFSFLQNPIFLLQDVSSIFRSKRRIE